MIFKKDELKYLGLFYFNDFFKTLFAVIGAYWIIYFNQKFSFSEIAIGMALMSIAIFLFEVPTGAIADVFGRKFSVILGGLLISLITLTIPFIDSTFSFWITLFVWGAAGTFISGAANAWIVDYLKNVKKESLIREYYKKYHSVSNFSFIFASLFGGLIVKYYGMTPLWFVQSAGFFLGTLILFKQKEYFKRRKTNIKAHLKHAYKNIIKGAKFSINHKVVFYLLMSSFFIVIGEEIASISWQPLLVLNGFKLEHLGYLLSLGAALGIFIPYITQTVIKKLKHEKYYFSSLTIIMSALYSLFFYIISPLFAGFVFVIKHLKFVLEDSVFEPYFQKFVPSKIRATVGSFKSLILSIGFLIGDLIVGLTTDKIGVQNSIVIAGIITLPAVFFFLKIKE